MIIDTHIHLYGHPDAASALKLALDGGVSDVVALGVDAASSRRHFQLRQELPPASAPRVHCGVGIHPGNIVAAEVDAAIEFFRSLCAGDAATRPVAIGETGMDFWYKEVRRDDARKDEQCRVFARHLDLAMEFGLPVALHARGAWRECLAMLTASGVRRAVFHWYTGPRDVLSDILDAGFMVSVTPALEYSAEMRAAGQHAPLDRILVETDTPAGVSAPGGGRVPSTPKDVWRALDALCALKALDRSEALSAVNANARALFLIP